MVNYQKTILLEVEVYGNENTSSKKYKTRTKHIFLREISAIFAHCMFTKFHTKNEFNLKITNKLRSQQHYETLLCYSLLVISFELDSILSDA